MRERHVRRRAERMRFGRQVAIIVVGVVDARDRVARTSAKDNRGDAVQRVILVLSEAIVSGPGVGGEPVPASIGLRGASAVTIGIRPDPIKPPHIVVDVPSRPSIRPDNGRPVAHGIVEIFGIPALTAKVGAILFDQISEFIVIERDVVIRPIGPDRMGFPLIV